MGVGGRNGMVNEREKGKVGGCGGKKGWKGGEILTPNVEYVPPRLMVRTMFILVNLQVNLKLI